MIKQPEHLMCRWHWPKVPRELRARVWHAYRRRRELPGIPGIIWQHVKACQAAIAAVSGPEQLALRAGPSRGVEVVAKL
jgi:hypothetical protein